jgi:DNA-binding CsgD family transcriptional regulator
VTAQWERLENGTRARFDILTHCLFLAWTPDIEACLANQRFADLAGEAAEGLIGRRLASITNEYWRDAPIGAPTFDWLAHATVETIRVRGELGFHGRPSMPVRVWARTMEIDRRVWGVAAGAPDGGHAQLSEAADHIGRALERLLLAIVDDNWTVLAIGGEVAAEFGTPRSDVVGTPLWRWLTPEDHPPDDDAEVGASRPMVLRRESGAVVPVSVLTARQPHSPRTRVCGICPIETSRDSGGPAPFRRLTPGDRQRIAAVAAVTDRQWEILCLLMDGMTSAEIGDELFVSASTVRNHLCALFRKFRVRNQHELLRLLTTIG